MDWIDLAQNRDRWPTILITVLNFRFPQMRIISWLAENRLASRQDFMDLVTIVCLFVSNTNGMFALQIRVTDGLVLNFTEGHSPWTTFFSDFLEP